MSELRVDSITNNTDNGPVDFPNGVSGSGADLSFDPKVINFSPKSLETNVSTGTNIVLTFDQDIKFDGSGNIEIRSGSSTGSLVETLSITGGTPASGLSISGTQLTINPTTTLSVNTTYYVILPSSGIKNLLGTASYAGTSSYSFQTAASSFSMSGGNHEFIQADSGSPTGYYKYHIFTGTTQFTLDAPSPNATDMTMFMVGGGGGGGAGSPSYRAGGGGGAGGLIKRTGSTWALPSGTYTMTIGSGGNGSQQTSPTANTNGGDTTITPPTSPTTYNYRAYGGGAGGYPANDNPPYRGNPGGSGGGAYSHATPNQTTQPTLATGGSGVSGQGNPGGGNTFYYPGTGHNQHGGGGGGAGAAGQRAFADGTNSPTSTYWYAGNGGNGLQMPEFPFSDIFSPGIIPDADFPAESRSRSNGYFAGGGGGGSAPPGPSYRGNGGLGGGGNGAGNYTPTSVPVTDRNDPQTPGANPTNYGQDGAARLGGGGGGGHHPDSSYRGGNGGSGVAMIRYAYPADLI